MTCCVWEGDRGAWRGISVFDADDAGFVGELDGEDEESGSLFSLVGEFQIDNGKIDIDRDHAEKGLLADIEDIGGIDAGMGAAPVFGGGGDQLGQGITELGMGGKDDAVVVTKGEAAEMEEVVDGAVPDNGIHKGRCRADGLFRRWGAWDDGIGWGAGDDRGGLGEAEGGWSQEQHKYGDREISAGFRHVANVGRRAY